MELNDYIENIKNDVQYAEIIEISIASKVFNINIFIYQEGPSNSNHYIIYEKIDSHE